MSGHLSGLVTHAADALCVQLLGPLALQIGPNHRVQRQSAADVGLWGAWFGPLSCPIRRWQKGGVRKVWAPCGFKSSLVEAVCFNTICRPANDAVPVCESAHFSMTLLWGCTSPQCPPSRPTSLENAQPHPPPRRAWHTGMWHHEGHRLTEQEGHPVH